MKKKDADLVDFNADLNKLINFEKEMVNQMQAFIYYTDGLYQKLRTLDDNYHSALHMKDVYEPDELKTYEELSRYMQIIYYTVPRLKQNLSKAKDSINFINQVIRPDHFLNYWILIGEDLTAAVKLFLDYDQFLAKALNIELIHNAVLVYSSKLAQREGESINEETEREWIDVSLNSLAQAYTAFSELVNHFNDFQKINIKYRPTESKILSTSPFSIELGGHWNVIINESKLPPVKTCDTYVAQPKINEQRSKIRNLKDYYQEQFLTRKVQMKMAGLVDTERVFTFDTKMVWIITSVKDAIDETLKQTDTMGALLVINDLVSEISASIGRQSDLPLIFKITQNLKKTI